MEIELSDIWITAIFLIGLQIAAFTWKVSREIAVAERGDINWLPPADIMNLIAMVVAFLGVFALPIGGIENPNVPQLALGLSIILFAGYPFALAGHYDLYTKGPRSYDYATKQEIKAVLVTIVAAIMFLCLITAHKRNFIYLVAIGYTNMPEFTFSYVILGIIVPLIFSGIALYLGHRANVLAKDANKIANQSDKKMKALADSQIDEKLAIMAEHLKESLVGSKNTAELKNWEQDYWLNDIRRIQSDFNAVTDLKEYASSEKKQELIENYIVPILKALNTIKENIPMSSEWNDILTEIAKTAWTYDIKTETIESFINH